MRGMSGDSEKKKRRRIPPSNLDRRYGIIYNWVTKVHKIQRKQKERNEFVVKIYRKSRGGKNGWKRRIKKSQKRIRKN